MSLWGKYSDRRKAENQVAGGMGSLRRGFGTLRGGGKSSGSGCATMVMLVALMVASRTAAMRRHR